MLLVMIEMVVPWPRLKALIEPFLFEEGIRPIADAVLDDVLLLLKLAGLDTFEDVMESLSTSGRKATYMC